MKLKFPQEPSPKRPASLTKKAGILAFSRTLTILTQMASMMVLTRTLSKESFGLLTFLLLVLATVINLSHFGLAESVFYFFERVSKAARKSFVLLTVRNLFLIGLTASTLLLILNYLTPPFWKYDLDMLIPPLVVLILIELLTLPLPNALIAIDRVKQAGIFNIVIGILQFTAMVVPALLGKSVEVIVYWLVAYGGCRLLLGAILFLLYFPQKPEQLTAGMSKEQFQYSVPLGISQILWGLNRQIDKFIVWGFLPVTVYAEYVVGSWEIPFIPAIAYSVSAVIMPKLVTYHLKDNKTALLDIWCRAIKKASIIVLPLAVLFLVAAEEFIATFFTDDYIAAALPFRIYTIIIFQRVAAYSSMFKAIGETKIIYYSALYLVLINLALSFPLVLWLGVAGPPLATLCANLFTWGYSLSKMKSALKVNFNKIFPFRDYGKTLAIALLSAIPALWLKMTIEQSFQMMLILESVVYLLAYVIIATATGIVRKEEWLRLSIRPKIK